MLPVFRCLQVAYWPTLPSVPFLPTTSNCSSGANLTATRSRWCCAVESCCTPLPDARKLRRARPPQLQPSQGLGNIGSARLGRCRVAGKNGERGRVFAPARSAQAASWAASTASISIATGGVGAGVPGAWRGARPGAPEVGTVCSSGAGARRSLKRPAEGAPRRPRRCPKIRRSACSEP